MTTRYQEKSKAKQAPIPSPRTETLRQSMAALLKQSPLTAQELSAQVGLAERQVYSHLRHIRQSLHCQAGSLRILPAECHDCGFVFAKRERLKKPGRCPICHGQFISQPRYLIADPERSDRPQGEK